MKGSVFFKTYGCQMNVYDSNRMLALMQKAGYEAAPDPARADVIVVNTCSIRAKSEQKVLTLLGQLKPLKDQNPDRVLALSGCVAQRMGRKLLQRVHHLDLVLGPDSIDQVVELVEGARKSRKRQVATEFEAPSRSYSQPAAVTQARPSEFLTIMKGCDHFCTYCIVPFVRGREKSRAIAEVIHDARQFVERGAKEIVFLGQNINTYGKGTGEKLSQLIEQASAIEGLHRIRYITSHPRDMGTDLIEQFGTIENLSPSLHLPFQSGSDAILKKMSRLYTRDEYLRKIDLLRKARPDIAMSTDVIVGFPGETDADFQDTLRVMREVRFSTAFLFKYSPRPGTRAMALSDTAVPESVKEERHKELLTLANDIIEKENKELIGRSVEVLIEYLDKKGRCYTGRSQHGKLVHVINAGPACLGKILSVKITEANASNLRGLYEEAPPLPRRDLGPEEPLSASISCA